MVPDRVVRPASAALHPQRARRAADPRRAEIARKLAREPPDEWRLISSEVLDGICRVPLLEPSSAERVRRSRPSSKVRTCRRSGFAAHCEAGLIGEASLVAIGLLASAPARQNGRLSKERTA